MIVHQEIVCREKRNQSILFVGKSDDSHTEKALQFCKDNFESVDWHVGRFGQGRFPEEIGFWNGDYIISYLSPWVVPDALLSRASKAALNFHPASPDYPGIGCNNFALYDNVSRYAAMCHHMASQVDTGSIVEVKWFDVYSTDTVSSILSRTHDHQLALFYDVMGLIMAEIPLPVANEVWSRKPYTRKELNALAKITHDMTEDEVKRRIRATSFEQWMPTVEIHGFTFELKI